MNFLPVLNYCADNNDLSLQRQKLCPPPISDAVQTVQTSEGKPPARAKKAAVSKSVASKQLQTPSASDARKKAVFNAMEQLLERGAFSDAELLRSIPNLSGDEFLQVAEERSLAGLCGNPRCSHHLQSQKKAPHYRIQGRIVYDLEDESKCTCSDKCQAIIAMIAQKLGNEDAALYRFTHPVKPDQPVASAAKPALSNTVVERNPSQKASHQTPLTSEPQAKASQLQHPDSSVQQLGKVGIVGPSHLPRKGSQAGAHFAAGNAKTPIMLAEIKEKDPSADEGFAAAAALRQQSAISAAGDQSAAQAVDGFVPKSRPTNAFKAKANLRKQAAVPDHGSSADQSTTTSHLLPAPSAAQGTSEAADIIAAPATCHSSATAAVADTLQKGSCSNGTADSAHTTTGSADKLHSQTKQLQATCSASHLSTVDVEESCKPALPNSLSQDSVLPAEAPVIAFEIDDADGPLEGAANGLSSQFGRLKVIDPSQPPLLDQSQGAARDSHAHLSQDYRAQADAGAGASDDNLDDEVSDVDAEELVGNEGDDEEDGGPGTSLEDPPQDFRAEMSPFGAIFTLLESWPTESTRAYLLSEDNADRQLRQSQILGTSQQMLKTMSTILARVVPFILQEMQIKVPRSTVEKHLYEMLASMHFPTPIPAIKDSHWQVLVLVLLKALSLHRIPSLQDTLESRHGLLSMDRLLKSQEFSSEMFDALLEVLVEG